MGNRICRIFCGLAIAACCGYLLYFCSEIVSLKRHPEDVSDRLVHAAQAIAEPDLPVSCFAIGDRFSVGNRGLD